VRGERSLCVLGTAAFFQNAMIVLHQFIAGTASVTRARQLITRWRERRITPVVAVLQGRAQFQNQRIFLGFAGTAVASVHF